MATVVYGEFEWDEDKELKNRKKHGVSFEEAAIAFQDPRQLVLPDGGDDPDCFVLMGMARDMRILFVVHLEATHERGNRYRIISARTANSREATQYANGDAS